MTSTTSTAALAPDARRRPAAAAGASPAATPIQARRTRPSRISSDDHAAGRRVDRHREPEPDARDRGVDADDAAAAVDQRAARVAGVERGVGLDDVVDRSAACRPSRAGSERPSADTTPAVTEPAKPCGLPIATTSWPTRSAAASPSSAGVERPRPRCAAPRGRSAGPRRPRARSSSRPSVNEAERAAPAPAPDDVGVGEHEAVGGDDDARAAAAAADPQVGDRRRERLGDVRDDPRVGVERLGVARQRAGGGGLSGVLRGGHLLNASDWWVAARRNGKLLIEGKAQVGVAARGRGLSDRRRHFSRPASDPVSATGVMPPRGAFLPSTVLGGVETEVMPVGRSSAPSHPLPQ